MSIGQIQWIGKTSSPYLYQSTDGGTSFNAWATLPFAGNASAFCTCAAGNLILVANVMSPWHVYQSRDGGLTWDIIISGVSISASSAMAIAADGQSAIITSKTGDTEVGVWVTTNNGVTWTKKVNDFARGAAINADGTIMMYASSTALMRSTNSGGTFSPVLGQAYMESVALAGNATASTGYAVCNYWGNPNKFYYSTDGGATWTIGGTTDVFKFSDFLTFSPDGSYLFSGVHGGTLQGTYFSQDGGQTFTKFTNGPATPNAPWTFAIASDTSKMLVGISGTGAFKVTAPFSASSSFVTPTGAPAGGSTSCVAGISDYIVDPISRTTAIRGVLHSDVDVNTSVLAEIASLSLDPYYSNFSNIKKIVFTYRNERQVKEIRFVNDGSSNFPTSSVYFSPRAHLGTWTLSKITLRDYDGGLFVIPLSEVPVGYDMEVSAS